MDPTVIAAMLMASLLHAAWHALVKSSDDRVVALAGMNVISGGFAIALLPFVNAMPAAAYALIAGSVLLHGAYKLALARLYVLADLGQAYPLARGFTPLIAAAMALAVLGEKPGLPAMAGLGLISVGILGLGFENRATRVSPRAAIAALVAGTMVAAYSVVDAYGIRLAGDWFSFTVWLVALDSTVFASYALWSRGVGAVRSWKRDWQRVLASGCLGVASFGVFMWALGVAPVGPVTALRETSVLFAAIFGTVLLRESPSLVRYAAAAAVMAGIGMIALDR